MCAQQIWKKIATRNTLGNIAIGILLVQGIGACYSLWNISIHPQISNFIYLSAQTVGIAITSVAIFQLRKHQSVPATGLLSLAILIPILIALIPFGIRQGNVLLISTTIPLMITGLYSGRRSLIAMASLIISFIIFLAISEQQEWFLVKNIPQDLGADTLKVILVIIVFTWVVFSYVGEVQESRRIMQNYQATLEAEVERRTREMHDALAAAEQARARAEQADATKSMFIASTSHELRTPLHAIMAMSKYLEKDGPLTEVQHNHLSRVHANASHLLGLINNVLDISKIEAGMLVLDRQPIQIDSLFEAVLRDSALLIQHRPITIERKIAAHMPTVYCDPVRLKQVLINLLANAVKFTPEGVIEIAASVEGDMLTIAISDTGVGIAESDIKTIFQPFRQAQGMLSRKYAGTGLGLPISKHLIEMHGGTLAVQSQLGNGSTFTIHMPIAMPSQPERDSAHSSSAG